VQQLRDLSGLLSSDQRVVHVIVDSGVLMDHPLREPDDHKRAGRTDTTREDARKVDQPPKGLRNSGDAPPTGSTKAGGQDRSPLAHLPETWA
jgi:hypothetical protein